MSSDVKRRQATSPNSLVPLSLPPTGPFLMDDKCNEDWLFFDQEVERVWGPLPLECTAEFGAHAPVCSFVVRPVLDVNLLEAVNKDVIGDAAPAHDETPETLRQRLAQSTAFDNPRIVYSKRTRRGHFKYQSDIAVREGGQSRRATFAKPVGPVVVDESGRAMVRMRGYKHLYRHREDARMCRPMPASLRTLRDVLYKQVRI